jgi:hypothetical protein
VQDWGDINIDEYTELRRELVGSVITREVDAATYMRNHGMKRYIESLAKLQQHTPSRHQAYSPATDNAASTSRPIVRVRPKDTFDTHPVRFIDVTVVDLETTETVSTDSDYYIAVR